MTEATITKQNSAQITDIPLKAKRILELDGLRAFAVTFVVLYHVVNWSGAVSGVSPFVTSILAILGEGGVHIFFVISGFIITSLLLRESNVSGGISLVSFYQRRFFRIVPPFAAYLLVLALLCKIDYITIRPINFLWSSLFLGNLGLFGSPHSASGWFVSHTWSLSVEEQYYLILPPIIVLILQFRLRPTNLLLIALFLLCLFANKLAKEAAIHISPGLIKLTALYPFRYIIVGVLLALHKEVVQKTLRNTTILLPIGLLLFILSQPLVSQFPAIVSTFLGGLEAVCYGFLVLWFVENPEKCAVLRWGWIQWIGACSYSIYLWQQLFTGEASFYNGWTIAQSPLAIVAIVACAALSYYFIELPSIRLGRFVSTKK